MRERLVNWSVRFPKTVLAAALLVTALFAAQFPKARIDTDPKHMLPESSAVRVYNDQVERQFSLHPDVIVVGVVNEQGLLNPESLRRVAEITDKILTLPGVIARDVLGLRTVDDVIVNGDQLGVRPLLADVPTNATEVAALRKALFENPLLAERFISADATTTAIYVPIEPTANGKEIADRLRRIVADYGGGPERFYVAGDPVARDTFGAQMFRQMGVFSPVAGMVMCVVLWLMFRSGALVAANMGVAMLSVVWAMGALIACGYPVHIMSSMIPVFLMAISTDTVHIFNEFYFRFGELRDKRAAVLETMRVVGSPVVLSDLTTAAAFASLATGPIVPVKVFGIFVAVGTLGILLMSFTVVPAVLMLMSERRLQAISNFKFQISDSKEQGASGWLAALGRLGVKRSRAVLLVGLGLLALAALGMSQIRVNNNMVSWFRARSEIRQADRVLNEKLGGTATGYLIVRGSANDFIKRPETLRWIESLQRELEKDPLVGKTVSVADVVKRINRVLHGDEARFETIPDSTEVIAQQLFVFTMAVKPRDLDNLVDYPFQSANVILQLKSWDADVMRRAMARAEAFEREHPLAGLPAATAGASAGIKPAGIAYFNLVWNHDVLWGMLTGFISSLVLVLVLLVIEYRSLRWGVISFVPLLFTVALIYGAVGLIGKDFDMPISVLSTLSLGMAIDFAIHFVSRFRQRLAETGFDATAGGANPPALAETLLWTVARPGRGVIRNAVLFASGFFVMLFASLTPYITVGAFMAAMMLLSAVATLLYLPALIVVFGRWLPLAPKPKHAVAVAPASPKSKTAESELL